MLAKVSKTQDDLGATWLDEDTNEGEVQWKKRVRCRVRNTEGAVEQELSGEGGSALPLLLTGVLECLVVQPQDTLRNPGKNG